MQFPDPRLSAVFERYLDQGMRLTSDIGAWTRIIEQRTQPYYDMQVE